MNRLWDMCALTGCVVLLCLLQFRGAGELPRSDPPPERNKVAVVIESDPPADRGVLPAEIALLFLESDMNRIIPPVAKASVMTSRDPPGIIHIGTVLLNEKEVFVIKEVNTGRIISLSTGETKSGYFLMEVNRQNLIVRCFNRNISIERNDIRTQ